MTTASGIGSDGTEVTTCVEQWTCDEVCQWLKQQCFSAQVQDAFKHHQIDGAILIDLTEEDMRRQPLRLTILGDIKRLNKLISALRGCSSIGATKQQREHQQQQALSDYMNSYSTADREGWSGILAKLFVSICIFFVSIFATSLTMTFVHERLPDPLLYPPLPDIILDHLPLIPWAFAASELIALSLLVMLLLIIVMHKYRGVILRRVLAVVSIVFLLRCVTMFVTSMSVPGKHLGAGCVQDRVFLPFDQKLKRAWEIGSRFGMSIANVKTCGDYFFSGHTSVLTILNLFICEYSPKKWRRIQIFTWLLNVFGMFFVLAAHEHYTLDVFGAFYISSKLFQYYHHHANIQHAIDKIDKGHKDSAWNLYLPYINYLEEDCQGKIPNEYEWPWVPIVQLFKASK